MDRDAVISALRAVLSQMPRRTAKIGLVIPDGSTKVSLLSFQSVPKRTSDLERLIQWQVRQSIPFAIEDAQLAYTPGITLSNGGKEFVTITMRREVLAEYEEACSDVGAHPGLVDLASFNLINVILAENAADSLGDWLLIHESPRCHSLAIVRNKDLIFFRNRVVNGNDERELNDLVHQSMMYYEDHLSGEGIDRAVLAPRACSDFSKHQRLLSMLKARLAVPVDLLKPKVAFVETNEDNPALLSKLAAPIGMFLRDSSVTV